MTGAAWVATDLQWVLCGASAKCGPKADHLPVVFSLWRTHQDAGNRQRAEYNALAVPSPITACSLPCILGSRRMTRETPDLYFDLNSPVLRARERRRLD
jgi:hypothetical protein